MKEFNYLNMKYAAIKDGIVIGVFEWQPDFKDDTIKVVKIDPSKEKYEVGKEVSK